NGAILGKSRREIAAKLDEIIDFSVVDGSIDKKVKHYSRGMYLRFSFSVAGTEARFGGDAGLPTVQHHRRGWTAVKGRAVRTAIRDGVSLRYEQAGGEGAAIVLVHGWCCDHTFLQPQLDYLAARGHTVVAVD